MIPKFASIAALALAFAPRVPQTRPKTSGKADKTVSYLRKNTQMQQKARCNRTPPFLCAAKEGLSLQQWLSPGERWEPLSKEISVIVSPQHTFNTDTLLLAWFAAPRRKDRCADLGTGCGTIPLVWHSRFQPTHVYAVELQEGCGVPGGAVGAGPGAGGLYHGLAEGFARAGPAKQRPAAGFP